METKVCSKQCSPNCCKEGLTSSFVPKKMICKECKRFVDKQFYDNNKNYFVDYHKKKYVSNADSIKKQCSNYYLKNKEAILVRLKMKRDAKKVEKIEKIENISNDETVKCVEAK